MTINIHWHSAPMSPDAMLAGVLRTEADCRESAARSRALYHLTEAAHCIAALAVDALPRARRRRGKAPSRAAAARMHRRAGSLSAAIGEHFAAAQAFGAVIEAAGDLRTTANKIDQGAA